MEELEYRFEGKDLALRQRPPVVVGVVSSGNLEVLVEEADLGGGCRFVVRTSANGFRQIWEALLTDFSCRRELANLQFSLNDAGATPAVVSLRLEQALEEFLGGTHE